MDQLPGDEGGVEKLVPLLSHVEHETAAQEQMLEPETGRHAPIVEQVLVPEQWTKSGSRFDSNFLSSSDLVSNYSYSLFNFFLLKLFLCERKVKMGHI